MSADKEGEGVADVSDRQNLPSSSPQVDFEPLEVKMEGYDNEENF